MLRFIRDDIISGRCELCQERIRNEKIAKERERAQKTPAEDCTAQNEVAKKGKPRKVTICLKINKEDGSRVPNYWSLGGGSSNKKSLEQSEPSSPPANPAALPLRLRTMTDPTRDLSRTLWRPRM